MTILLCYDGSDDAQAAIDRAAVLMPGSDATVLVIWETIVETLARHGSLGMGFGMLRPDGADPAIKLAAVDTAAAGVERAAAAGLVAQPRVVNRDDDIAAVVLAEAADLDAEVIVLGTRGVGGVKSLMLGSVSHAVLHHADRAVLVIPFPSLAEQRHHWAQHAPLTAGITSCHARRQRLAADAHPSRVTLAREATPCSEPMSSSSTSALWCLSLARSRTKRVNRG